MPSAFSIIENNKAYVHRELAVRVRFILVLYYPSLGSFFKKLIISLICPKAMPTTVSAAP